MPTVWTRSSAMRCLVKAATRAASHAARVLSILRTRAYQNPEGNMREAHLRILGVLAFSPGQQMLHWLSPPRSSLHGQTERLTSVTVTCAFRQQADNRPPDNTYNIAKESDRTGQGATTAERTTWTGVPLVGADATRGTAGSGCGSRQSQVRRGRRATASPRSRSCSVSIYRGTSLIRNPPPRITIGL